MICIKTQYFNLNRILLLAIGLWPYHQSKFVRFQAFLFFSILTSFIIFQLTAFITTKCTPEFIIKVLSNIMVSTAYIIQYNSFWMNTHNLKCLLEQLQNVCNELKDKNEVAIFEEYGNISKYLTTISFAMCGAFNALFLPIWPQILGSDLHINVSQSRQTMQIVTEYFIDQEKYFYFILLHKNVVICIGATTLTGTGTMFIGYFIYICGVFRIASYRIERAMTTKIRENINIENQTMIYKDIIDAIEIHRKAIKFTDFISSTFSGSVSLLIIIGVVSLSLNIFGIFRNASLGDKESFLLNFLFVLVILICMFVGNYAGQEITNHNNHVYFAAYNSRWYIAPLHAQKLIFFILLRGGKSVNVNIGGLIVASLECFTNLTKTSMSYFTVMSSMQE
ncbi:odorant receptor 4-like [Camponotus floridanus]|uniref:odorant receptor 4-like n=1 Tax=Camponotus floridanus TaxID=104421 RepID=UPI000DC6BE9F|nr:odorant receptor 4-like [Camponotus floridanus]